MKKIFYAMVFCGALLAACQENEMNTFDSEGAVYFQLVSNWSNKVDSVIFSFAGNPLDKDTVWLQVDLMGEAVDYDRTLKVSVDAENTTAVEGLHYEALQPSYILPAGAYQMQVPVVLYNKDPMLESKTFQLAVQLEPTVDLQLGLTSRTKARIQISSMLEKPVYYDILLVLYFGPYSRCKHELCIQVLGRDFPATNEECLADIYYWMAAGSYMDAYFYDNYPIIDPETNLPIEPWL